MQGKRKITGRSMALQAGLALFLAAAASAQISVKDAFPGLKFNRVVCIAEMPGQAQKTYAVLEQHLGQINIVQQKDGAWTKQTMLKITVATTNEMGLLGIAFHPDYKNNRRYFIYYNPTGALKDVVEEREADVSFIKDAGKSKNIISLDDPASNHNGGSLGFGPDGFLYAAIGDGGGQNNQYGNGQNRKALFSKMLRLDVDHPADGKNYGIPADNPFVADPDPDVKREIWAWGLRNPWRWTFDPLNGDLWVADVGQNAIEEVDLLAKGANYGWPNMEGPDEYLGTKDATMVPPVFSYPRAKGNCIIGAAVYRGNPLSKYYGNFFFTDESTRILWALKKNGTGAATAVEVDTLPAKPATLNHDFESRIFVGVEADAQPVYMLDSPDLAPAATSAFSRAVRERFGRTRFLSRNAPWSAALSATLFADDPSLELSDMSGSLAATLYRANADLSRIRPGLYAVRSAGSLSKPDLWVVR
jgi:glucose/arabinose dehydrogenase